MAWALAPPLVAAVVFGAAKLAGAIARPPPPSANEVLVAAARAECRPEPAEMLGYLLASLGACAVLFAVMHLAPRLARIAPIARPLRLLAATSIGAVVLLAFLGDFTAGVKTYTAFTGLDALGGGLTVLLAGWLVRRGGAGSGTRTAAFLATAVTALLAGWILVPSIFRDGSFLHADANVIPHIPFIVAEFMAPAVGRTPLVDFHPQYVNLLPLLTGPFMRATAGSLGPFTLLMAAGSLACLAGWWAALRMVTRSSLAASLLLLPMLLVTVYWPELAHWPLTPERSYVFDYYALAPLRFLLPCLGLPLVVRAVREESFRGWLAAGAVAGLAALNNLDFGVVFAAAAAVVAVLFGSVNGRRIACVGAFLAGAFAAVAAGILALAWHGHALPSFRESLEFQRAFAATGFYMLPLPEPEPLQWLVFATHLAGVGVGLYSRVDGSPDGRVRGALLVLAGLDGLGTGTYYVGRSHPLVLIGLFLPWAFTVVLLAWEGFRALRREGPRFSGWTAIPAFLLLFQCGLFVARVRQLPTPQGQVARLTNLDDRRERWFDALVQVIGREVPPGVATDVIYPDGHLLALRAGVDDRFEFAHPGSLILLSQVDAAAAQIERTRPTRVFGNFAPELAARLGALGYSRVGAVPQVEVRLAQAGYPEFEVWAR